MEKTKQMKRESFLKSMLKPVGGRDLAEILQKVKIFHRKHVDSLTADLYDSSSLRFCSCSQV